MNKIKIKICGIKETAAIDCCIENNVEHWVLWWNPRKDNSVLDDNTWVEKTIEKKWCRKDYEYSCFENFTKDRSVKTIRHFQIFIKKK